MESLRATYIDEDEDDNNNNLNSTPTECTTNTHVSPLHPIQTPSSPSQQNPQQNPLSDPPNLPEQAQPSANDEVESSSIYNNQNDDDDNNYHNVPATATTNNDNDTSDHNVEEPETELEDPQQPLTTSSSEDNTITTHVAKKQKPLASFISPSPLPPATSTPLPPLPPGTAPTTSTKKPKKKAINVWTKSTSRKNKKKAKIASAAAASAHQSTVLITPIPRFPDRSDDSPDAVICLSKIYKAEKVELSDDRLSAGSTKGYRMVRATRGVIEGAWYFEIKVVNLGETGHTRLGWCTEKGDLQAPVGYDGNSFGYRDVDGSKVHRAVREAYGERGYGEGDVVGCYINLPEGGSYAPKPPHLVWYKGQRYAYAADGKDDPPMVIPGSEMSFFKNGVCQGVAFTNLYGGRYYPAASMFTRPNQPNCVVKFNFGPEFEFFPQDFEGRPIPRPIIEVPYHGCDGRPEGPIENGVSIENKS